MFKENEIVQESRLWATAGREFPVLPTLPLASIPVQTYQETGHHISEGERNEFAVVDFFKSPLLASWVEDIRHVARNPHFDKQGIDAQLRVRTCTPEGAAIADMVGYDNFSIQVKSSDRSARHFVQERAKRERDREIWRERGLMVMNGTYPDEFKAADMALQMMILSENLFEPDAIQALVGALDPDMRKCVTHHYIMPLVIDKRSLLIRKFYPQHDPRNNQSLADMFIKAK